MASLAAGLCLFALGLLGIEARAHERQDAPALGLYETGKDI